MKAGLNKVIPAFLQSGSIVACLAAICFASFFFQAEDGIRDYKVTGVQTCALPIFPCAHAPAFRAARLPVARPAAAGASLLLRAARFASDRWPAQAGAGAAALRQRPRDRKRGVEGKSGDLGGRRIIKKKKKVESR